MNKRISWITADYFLDVDFQIVPYLMEHHDLNINWLVVSTSGNKITVPEKCSKLIHTQFRGRDPRLILKYLEIIKAIDLSKTDLIYSNYLGIPYYYPVLLFFNRKYRIPLIHAAHNVIPYDVWPASLVYYVRYVFKKNKHFHLFSKFTYQYFTRRYPDKSSFYCPMALKGFGDVSTNNYPIDNTKVNLLFFGNVIDNKRLDLLINAVKNLPKEIKTSVHLTICGKCNDTEKYLMQINGCREISTYFKRIDDCEIAELFTRHNYLMLPYQDVAQSGPHMIAYYYNLPVIASDIDGLSERVIDGVNGFLFKVNNEQSLIETIIKAVNLQPSKYRELKENLTWYAQKNFGLKKISSHYVDYFNSII